MNWKDITRKKGDDGKSDFQGQRKNKSSLIFELLGEIDMLNAQLGVIAAPFNDIGKTFQRINREIMGYMYTKGASTLNDWETFSNQLLANITKSMDEDEIPCDGWIDYDNHLYVVCCQIRKVERLFCKLKNNKPPLPEHSLDRFIRVYNRMSKIFFCLGAKVSNTINNINLDNEEELCNDVENEQR